MLSNPLRLQSRRWLSVTECPRASPKLRPYYFTRAMMTTTTASIEQELLVQDRGSGVKSLTLNRPTKRNALNESLLKRLENAFTEIVFDEKVKCVILRATGTVFSSGHDLTEMRVADETKVKDIFETCSRVMTMLAELPQPTIGVVDGLATAAGLQLLLSCDIVIASERSAFATPGVDIGLFCSTPSVALVRSGGNRRLITEMLFTGRRVDAREALDGGLITRVSLHPDEDALQTAQLIASKSATALRLGKKVLREHSACPRLEDSYKVATKGMIDNMATFDAEEGIAAFLEKRKPHWR